MGNMEDFDDDATEFYDEAEASGTGTLVVFYKKEVQVFPLHGAMTLGRETEKNHPDIAIHAPVVSRKHGMFSEIDGDYFYTDTNSANGTIRNYRTMKPGEAVRLKDGDLFFIHGKEMKDVYHADVVMLFTTTYKEDTKWQFLPFTKDTKEIKIGRSESELSMQAKTISRHHASFYLARDGWNIIDMGSTNGTFHRGKRLLPKQAEKLYLHDVLRIAGYFFLYTGDGLLFQNDKVKLAADASEPVKTLHIDIQSKTARAGEGLIKHLKTIIKDIHLDIHTGEMVLILGGSGAGKTTFLDAVMGNDEADAEITYDHINVYEEYDKMRFEIGYVQQIDSMRKNDTVYCTLYDEGKVRLPDHTSKEALSEKVMEVLEKFGLSEVKDSKVRQLSGGQIKRLAVACEYIGGPSLFFLDEPDSGLDYGNAESVMQMLHVITRENKIVVVITHSPDRIREYFDKVLVLAKSTKDNVGHQAFYGTTDEACTFFGTKTLEQIVKRVNPKAENGEGRGDEFIEKYQKLLEEDK